jgi:hypothetical protein
MSALPPFPAWICKTGLAVTVLFLARLAAFGQYTTATLDGTVLDPSGASLPDASITVRNTGTGFTQTVHFNAPGNTVGTPNFGRITGAGSPRIIQLAAKITF